MKTRTKKRRPAKAPQAFPSGVLALLRSTREFRIRAGDGDHRFTRIWFVMLGDRVFVRPYSDSATGWYRAFQKNPRGAITVGTREIPVRARTARGSGLFDRVDAAYALKYATKANLKWVRGFHQSRRRKTTTELRPR
jgi:hypothetical protein